MNFQERFKGKTSLITKNGPTALLAQPQQSIPKFVETNKTTDYPKYVPLKPLKLPLQTYNPKYPPSNKDKHLRGNLNPFLVQNPYRQTEDAENLSNTANRKDLNNFQAHHIASPSIQKSVTSSKDILVSNSRTIMMESPFEVSKDHTKRPPSYDNLNPKVLQFSRKSNTADGPSEIDTDLKYKPYTLKDYNEIKKTAGSTSQKGLGPNINTEDWLSRKEKLEKMMSFSQNVKIFNSKKLSENIRDYDYEKEAAENAFIKSKRDKALDFAKNIPKPVLPIKKIKPDLIKEVKKQEFRDELQILEQQHLKLLDEIEKNIKNNSGKKN